MDKKCRGGKLRHASETAPKVPCVDFIINTSKGIFSPARWRRRYGAPCAACRSRVDLRRQHDAAVSNHLRGDLPRRPGRRFLLASFLPKRERPGGALY